ncbi:carboxylesterase NlhH-like [Dreissena polymorpha]|uniref:Alpha/beta hydrolase fold-3 domain-containing protein n=1 Tax=Dreissena polymorpha TaxID=45954 RepID=A0A9D4KHQ9_DREPO|nr:carboxylesterase NlhH-like [Dreissena polymorpha]KAH3839740.1 hypothetical protein DPMN_113174 [Dreissena polymorpha]
MKLFKGLFALSALIATVAIYFRPVFPNSASNLWLKTLAGLHVKLIHAVSVTGGALGFSPINITRAMTDVMLIMNRPSPDVTEEWTTMAGVPVLLYRPAAALPGLQPAIIHIHGGGWALMSPAHYGPVCRELVRATNSVVASIDYRRSPEHLYPVPLNDVITATKHFLSHADMYHVDKNRIAVKGDSAGGNLALALVLNLTSEVELPAISALSLDYPAIQLFNFDLPSYHTYEYGPCFLTKTLMINYWLTYIFGHRQYFSILYNREHIDEETLVTYEDFISPELLPEFLQKESKKVNRPGNNNAKPSDTVLREIRSKIRDPMIAPLMASDDVMSKLPPTYVLTAEFDALRDESFILVERLRRVGVKVEHAYCPHEEHGFLNFADIDSNAKREIGKAAAFIIKALNH